MNCLYSRSRKLAEPDAPNQSSVLSSDVAQYVTQLIATLLVLKKIPTL